LKERTEESLLLFEMQTEKKPLSISWDISPSKDNTLAATADLNNNNGPGVIISPSPSPSPAESRKRKCDLCPDEIPNQELSSCFECRNFLCHAHATSHKKNALDHHVVASRNLDANINMESSSPTDGDNQQHNKLELFLEQSLQLLNNSIYGIEGQRIQLTQTIETEFQQVFEAVKQRKAFLLAQLHTALQLKEETLKSKRSLFTKTLERVRDPTDALTDDTTKSPDKNGDNNISTPENTPSVITDETRADIDDLSIVFSVDHHAIQSFISHLGSIATHPSIHPPGNNHNPLVNSTPLYRLKTPSTIFGTYGRGDGQFDNPFHVTHDEVNQHIIVTDSDNHRIQVFDTTGQFLFKFGDQGSLGDGLFQYPRGVATTDTGDIIVADKFNHRIQVFTKDGKFLFKFGQFGTKLGQFQFPQGLAFDRALQHIVIVDTDNRRIQVFDKNGQFLFRFGDSGQIAKAWGVATQTDTQEIVVTDCEQHQVLVFDSTGSFLFKFGSEGTEQSQFSYPYGVATNPLNGNIVIADCKNKRIQIFDRTGHFLEKFDIDGYPYGVAVSYKGELIVTDEAKHRVQIFSRF